MAEQKIILLSTELKALKQALRKEKLPGFGDIETAAPYDIADAITLVWDEWGNIKGKLIQFLEECHQVDILLFKDVVRKTLLTYFESGGIDENKALLLLPVITGALTDLFHDIHSYHEIEELLENNLDSARETVSTSILKDNLALRFFEALREKLQAPAFKDRQDIQKISYTGYKGFVRRKFSRDEEGIRLQFFEKYLDNVIRNSDLRTECNVEAEKCFHHYSDTDNVPLTQKGTNKFKTLLANNDRFSIFINNGKFPAATHFPISMALTSLTGQLNKSPLTLALISAKIDNILAKQNFELSGPDAELVKNTFKTYAIDAFQEALINPEMVYQNNTRENNVRKGTAKNPGSTPRF